MGRSEALVFSAATAASLSKSRLPHKAAIGGPGTYLPFIIESLLSWLLCIYCLSISFYFYIIFFLSNKSKIRLPLATCSKAEKERLSSNERLFQLQLYLQKKHNVNSDFQLDAQELSQFIHCIRNDIICRRLATLSMCHGNSTSILQQQKTFHLAFLLSSIWSHLLELPSCPSSPNSHIQLSVIISAFRENGASLLKNLQRMHKSCQNPKRIEIIIVDAGQNTNFTKELILNASSSSDSYWENIHLLEKAPVVGRGQCLNYGAKYANNSNSILLFCHADMILPNHWDEIICQTFYSATSTKAKTTLASVFSFGINATSPKPIPGLMAVETTANIRSFLFTLPYGDQTISMPKYIFDYIGGFPHQSLMEDYVLVDLLRKRTFLSDQKEIIALQKQKSFCDSRRWEKFGVLYVTWMNYSIVYWYNTGKKGIRELYEVYYGLDIGTKDLRSDWEVELDKYLKESS